MVRIELRTYFLFKTEHCKESYLDYVDIVQHRISLAKFRTSSHKLNIEIGRYKGLAVKERICNLCNQNLVEDECHMFSKCSAFSDLRLNIFQKLSSICQNFISLNDEDKFVWAMSNPEPDICKLVAKFIHECFLRRESLILV